MAEKPEAALWIDVSTLKRVQWTAGVPRLIQQILHHWRLQNVPVRMCHFDPVARFYREVNAVAPPVRIPRGNPAFATSASRWQRKLTNLLSRLTPNSFAQANRRFSEAAFEPGAVLFSADLDFASLPGRDALPRLRQERGVRIASVVCDVIPVRCSHFLDPALKTHFETWLSSILAASDLVLTISEFSCQDLLRYCRQRGLSCPPIRSIRLGDEPGPDAAETPLERFTRGSDRGFALCVGTISHHKNQWLLLNVWRRLLRAHGAKAPRLVFVGGGIGACQQALIELLAEDEELAGHVVYCSEVSDAELRWLYRHCRFTLFPSHYEGWGLPVAEGLAYGKYCVCSSAASLPEVGGDLVDYHDPYDGGECQRLIERAAFEPGWLEQREQRIRREYRVTSWGDAAGQILRVLRQEFHLAQPFLHHTRK